MTNALVKNTGSPSSASTYLMVPILIFFVLLIFAVIRGPALISSAGIGSAIIVVAPLNIGHLCPYHNGYGRQS